MFTNPTNKVITAVALNFNFPAYDSEEPTQITTHENKTTQNSINVIRQNSAPLTYQKGEATLLPQKESNLPALSLFLHLRI